MDTGSGLNFIDQGIFGNISGAIEVEGPLPQPTTANGTSLQLVKKVVFPLEVGGQMTFHEWFVCRNLEPNILLGIEVMSNHSAKLELDSSGLQFTLRKGPRACEVCRRYSARCVPVTTTSPPDSSLVPGATQGVSTIETVSTHQVLSFPQGVNLDSHLSQCLCLLFPSSLVVLRVTLPFRMDLDIW